MRYDDMFVGLVALFLGLLAISFATGPWLAPYQLRTIAKIHARYGKHTARVAWLLIAILSGCSGLAILSGLRPTYASPPAKLNLAR
ncbi:MAG: hypothetical protein AAGC97_03755 [Planctomycetota bacterium]